MSTSPEADFDLEKLFLPNWAKESPQLNRYAKFEGEPERRGDRGDRRDRPPRRREGGPGRGPAPSGGFGGPQRGGRPQGAPRGQGGPMRRGRDSRDGGQDRRQDLRRPAPVPQVPLPDVQVAFTPEELGVDMLTKQIRITGRAYPLFEIANLILQKPERHTVTLSVKKKPDGSPVQPLFVCALDETPWLSEDDAIDYVLTKHFNTFYQPERTKIDPPKGVYTFVAQCGMSGVILGPPNYHDYQNQLRKLHAEKFSRMPFEAFKSRVKIVKDEEVVKKWVDDQSWKTEYNCLNLPEPLKLNSMEEVQKHFREVHLANIIKPVEAHRMNGPASRNVRDRELMRLIRLRWEDQKRFPLQLATVLSQQFAARGLSFFKVNKTVTHVAVARPHYLDLESTPVSEGVRRIVEFINSTPKCTHRRLLETLAPAPVPAPTPAAPAPEGDATASSPNQDATAQSAPAPAEPSPELAAVMTDLHWLIHQGHVIEFANGVLETAKKPLPRPPKPAKAEAPAAAATPAEAAAPEEGVVSGPEVKAVESDASFDSSDAPAETVTQNETQPIAETAGEDKPASGDAQPVV